MQSHERGALSGRVAVVAGASRGIGEAVARQVVVAGADVVAVARQADRLAEAAARMGACGGDEAGRVLTVPADVTHEEEVTGLFDGVVAEFGRVDILVNAVGVLRLGRVEELDLAAWEMSLAVNLTAAFLLSREAVRRMLAQAPRPEGLQGHIVHVVSGAAVRPWPGATAYASAKAGQLALCDSLREEVRDRGIKITAVLPGVTRTDMTAGPLFDLRGKLEPGDVADAVVAALVTGPEVQVMRVDVRPLRETR